MFGNNATARLRQLFADQFELDGQKYVYRKSTRGAPIQVSPEERDRFITTFNNAMTYAYWGLFAGIIILALSAVFYTVEAHTNLSDSATYVGIGVVMAAFMAVYYWAWNLPARELRSRGTVGEARSRAEVKRLFFAKLTYGQLSASAGIAIFLLIRIDSKEQLLSGWNIIWVVLAAAILVMAVIQAFRKWRFDRFGPD